VKSILLFSIFTWDIVYQRLNAKEFYLVHYLIYLRPLFVLIPLYELTVDIHGLSNE